MIIRLVSDLHLEVRYMDLPTMAGENQQVLILAGDIGVASKPATFVPFLEDVSARFRKVIYVLGNHEHYHGSFARSIDKIKRELKDLTGMDDVHVVNNETVKVDDVSFVCSTMWSSYENNDPISMFNAQRFMNDHRLIRNGPTSNPYSHKFVPQHAYDEFVIAEKYIFETIAKEKADGQKVVVVTHQAPSWKSVLPKYMKGMFADLNGAYASNLDDKIIETKPDIWVHGHMHDSFDYMIGDDTRVVVNPRGYGGHEINAEFDPYLRLNI